MKRKLLTITAVLGFLFTSVDSTSLIRDVHEHGGVQKSGHLGWCTREQLVKIKGYLLDLDGTIYDRRGLLDGAVDFFDWLEMSNTPFVLLSNGFKTKEGVSNKLASDPFKLNQFVHPDRVHTAGVAIARYMKEKAPVGARIFAVGTGIIYPDNSRDFITRIIEREVPEELFDTWQVRTDMTMDEIAHWAHLARKGEPVFVVLAAMGDPDDKFGDDPVTRNSGYSTMDYELMKRINTLLRNNAFFVVGAPDVADSQPRHPEYPDVDMAWPTMGGFQSLFTQSAEIFSGSEKERNYLASTGKGGNKGAEYMMKPGIEMLQSQFDEDLNLDEIMIIGDNFGTDIKAGGDAGIQSMLVLSGAHQLHDAINWERNASCYLPNVGWIPKIMKEE